MPSELCLETPLSRCPWSRFPSRVSLLGTQGSVHLEVGAVAGSGVLQRLGGTVIFVVIVSLFLPAFIFCQPINPQVSSTPQASQVS